MNQPGTGYQRLGHRTLVVFLLRSLWTLLVSIILIVGLGIAAINVPLEYANAATMAFWIVSALGLLSIVGSMTTAWMRYSHYGVWLDSTSFKFKQGIVSEEEIGVPYRRIKEVRLRRSPFGMMMGVSTLIVTTVQDEDEDAESKLQIDSLDKNLAAQLQDELLKRADVERVQVDAQKAAALH